MNPKQPNYTKCTYTEGGVKCTEKAMPVAKYCRKHILNDPSQVLYKRCGRVQADIECNEPVLSIIRDATCRFHTDFPLPRNYGERWVSIIIFGICSIMAKFCDIFNAIIV